MRSKALVLVAGIGLLAATTSYAAPLMPGSALLAPAEPDPNGGVVLASLTSDFFGSDVTSGTFFSGTLTTQVISGDANNPLGGLTFTYQFSIDPESTTSIARFSIDPFDGFGVDVSYLANTGVVPHIVDRTDLGDVIGYSFTNPPIGDGRVAAGQISSLLVIQTDAPAFRPARAALTDGTTVEPNSYAAAIPEPGSVGLLSLGALALLRRRRTA